MKTILFCLIISTLCTSSWGQQLEVNNNRPSEQEMNLAIITAIIAQFQDKAHWNKHSVFGEACAPKAEQQTLGCALKTAQIEFKGSYEHRNLLMRVVRKNIRKYFFFRQGFHPIDGFNKHKKTSHKELLFLLEAVKKELAAND